MRGRNGTGRAFTRVVAILGLVAAGAWAGDASAWTYPLLPHVQGLAFFPERPDDATPTSFELSAVYPSECWQLVDGVLLDSAHVHVTLRPASACGDTGSHWTASWVIGVLSAGTHTLTVHCTVENGTSTPGEEEITVPFDVAVAAPPPPPPPPGPGPPPVDTVTTLVNQIEVTPGAPLLGDHVQVWFRGRYPFDCGSLSAAGVPGDSAMSVTLAQATGCTDTTRVWEHTFDLGVPAAGEHLDVLHVLVPSLAFQRDQWFRFTVTDPNAPPPPAPPPPGDSLQAGLSASVPNPFSVRTSFAVSLAEPKFAEVAVFDLSGRRVVTIHRGVLPRGTTGLAWDGRRSDGSRAPGGIYFYRLTLPERVVNRRVVLLGTP